MMCCGIEARARAKRTIRKRILSWYRKAWFLLLAQSRMSLQPS